MLKRNINFLTLIREVKLQFCNVNFIEKSKRGGLMSKIKLGVFYSCLCEGV